jgi:hypothetical protein
MIGQATRGRRTVEGEAIAAVPPKGPDAGEG